MADELKERAVWDAAVEQTGTEEVGYDIRQAIVLRTPRELADMLKAIARRQPASGEPVRQFRDKSDITGGWFDVDDAALFEKMRTQPDAFATRTLYSTPVATGEPVYQYRARSRGSNCSPWVEITKATRDILDPELFEFRTLYTAPVASGEPVARLYRAALTALETLRGCAATYVEDHEKDSYPGEIGLRPQDVAGMWAQEIHGIDVKAFLDEAIAELPDATPQPAAEKPGLPRALGVSRDAESPGGKGVLVAFERALTDDELRALHDRLSGPTAAQKASALIERASKPAAEKEAQGGRMNFDTFMAEAKRTGLTLDALAPALVANLESMERAGTIRRHEDGGHEYTATQPAAQSAVGAVKCYGASRPGEDCPCAECTAWRERVAETNRRNAAAAQAQPSLLRERDLSKPAEQQGLFRKFEVNRVDGSDQPGGKHFGCRYYVLDLTHDQHAPAAMRAYAAECRSTHPHLADDIEREFGAAQAQPVAVPEGFVLMPERLTAENGAKGALSGEFKESATVTCHECGGSGDDAESDNDAECPECKGDGTIDQDVPVTWESIKRIYRKAVEICAAAPAQQDGQEPHPDEVCKSCGNGPGQHHEPDCVYEGAVERGFPGKGGAGARKLVGYGPCKCTLSHYCDGKCNPTWADQVSAAPATQPAVGGEGQ